MTTLASGLSTDINGCFASMQGRAYFANDFDSMKVWNPPGGSIDSAGITGPTAAILAPTVAVGVTKSGDHLVRYRHKNSRTGYYSNPSDAITVTVSGGNGQLTFSITALGSGGAIIRSTDSKVDTIVLEMAPVNSPTYYVAGTALQTSASIVISMADTTLIQQTNVQSIISTDGFGHEPPPLGAVIISHKGRLFLLGTSTRTRTSVTMTNGSATVTGTNFSTNWAGRIFIVSGETTGYEIASVSSSTTMALTVAYAGTTAATKSISVASKTPNRIYWTAALYPEAWKPLERARDCLQNKADEVRGAYSYLGDLFIFGRASSERLSYSADPSTLEGVFIPLPGTRGVFNQQCLVEAEGTLYAWDRQGIYGIAGGVPDHISNDIDTYLLSNVDFSQYAQFHAGYDPIDRVLMFFYVAQGDTVPKWGAAHDLDTEQWFLVKFNQGITASRALADSQGQVRLMLGDANGYTWFYGIDGGFDGVPPTSPTVVTTSGTPTVTSVTITGSTLPTGTTTLAGVVAYDPATGNTAVISSNTATVMTMASPGFTAAPASGVELWLGPITTDLRSKWWSGPGPIVKKRPVCRLWLYPGSATGKLRLYIYQDFAIYPSTVGTTANALPDGVSAVGSYFSINLSGGGNNDGYIDVPMLSDASRWWQWRIVSDRPDGAFRLLNVEFIAQQSPQTVIEPVNE